MLARLDSLLTGPGAAALVTYRRVRSSLPGMHQLNGHSGRPPTLIQDIRLVFSTILTDPGSSLAYGADSVVAITIGLLATNYYQGAAATLCAGGTILFVYFLAVLVFNRMTHQHVHPVLGGGAFVSAHITASKINRHPRFKSFLNGLGMGGTASLLADFPATQAISVISGVEALYFIMPEQRLQWAFGFVLLLSFIQRYGLGNLARFMIWPVLAFYLVNFLIQLAGVSIILDRGWTQPVLENPDVSTLGFLPILFSAVANGATLMTGVEVGYSSVNFPYHRGRAIRISMWILYALVLVTYLLQLVNFLGLGVHYDLAHHKPVPIEIAIAVGNFFVPGEVHLFGNLITGSDLLATPFGLLTTTMLLLAAQTAQSDFPLELLRASRSNFFPHGIGDSSWRKTVGALGIGGHEGVYNPRAVLLLGILSMGILFLFPGSHEIEGMYGLAVVTAVAIDIFAFMIRQFRAGKYSPVTILSFLAMSGMLVNILYNKFFHGAWFIVILMGFFMLAFLFSHGVYRIYQQKINLVPLELALQYPAFNFKPVDTKNVLLVATFHPGVIHFLKGYIRSGHMPLVVHFQTGSDTVPRDLPEWFRNVKVPTGVDTVTAITRFVRWHKPARVHLIPLLVRGIDPVRHYFFGNSITRLEYALSYHTDVQVEYNKERVNIGLREIIYEIFPRLQRLSRG